MSDPTENQELEGHPIRYLIAAVVKDGDPKKEPAVFDADGLEQIRKEIRSHIGSPELVDCVETVLGLAAALEVEQRSPRAAQALFQLVENDEIIKALKELNQKKDAQRAEAVAKAADKLTAFTGSESQKKAPKSDDHAPKGSIKLGNLDFPKKL
jgi:hypothetical protein